MTQRAATTPKRFTEGKPSRTSSKKARWNVFGLRKENQRDDAAIAFARLGLLAYRW